MKGTEKRLKVTTALLRKGTMKKDNVAQLKKNKMRNQINTDKSLKPENLIQNVQKERVKKRGTTRGQQINTKSTSSFNVYLVGGGGVKSFCLFRIM